MIVILLRNSQSLNSFIPRTFFDVRARLSKLAFVPKCDPVKLQDIRILKQYLDSCGRLCVLTGAGISTESGIPDYRSEGVGLFATSNRRPMSYKEFCDSELARKRYWARNFVGWPRFSTFEPNETHKTLQQLEVIGKVKCVVTQNVDSLHLKAGSKNVIELHGTAFRVICLDCDVKISRFAFQEKLAKLNPLFMSTSNSKIRPDGDVDLSEEQVTDFLLPPCAHCGGPLKPDIVFFGDNVSRGVVENVKEQVENANALLVLGTSLTTFSGYRIVLQAIESNKQVFIINIGLTRADDVATFKIQARCGAVLQKIYNFNNDIS